MTQAVTGPNITDDSIMVAMLVPSRFSDCLHFHGPALDLGITLLQVIRRFEAGEFAVELGGHTFALSMELVHTLPELRAASAA